MSEEILPGFTCEFVHEGDTCKLIDFLVDENRKLRNEVDNLRDLEHLTSVAVAYAGCDECGEYKQTMLRLFAENAKLRELAKKLYGGYMGGRYMMSCNECERAYEDDGGYVPLDPDYCVFSFSDRYVGCWRQKRLEAEMRELGVEVPE